MDIDDKSLDSFVQGMIEVDYEINKYNPDHIFVPLMGSAPFIDCLNIFDDDFDNEIIEYIPASSKLKDMKSVLRTWFKNFLKENYFPKMKVLSIDEVISGNSLQRVYKQFLNGKRDFFEERSIKYFNELNQNYIDKESENITYKSIGVVDSTLQKKKGKQNKKYQKLREKGVVIPVRVKRIITMDRPEFIIAKYKTEKINGSGKRVFYPEIDSFEVSPQYMNFLKEFASLIGKDPNQVTVRNIGKIMDSNKYLGDYKNEI